VAAEPTSSGPDSDPWGEEDRRGRRKAEPPSSGSGIDLGPEVFVAQPATESGIDLGAVPAGPGGAPKTMKADIEAVEDIVTVDAAGPAAEDSSSVHDVVAEVVEDEGLPSSHEEIVAEPASGGSAEEIVLEAAPEAGEPWSSSVDLGSVTEAVGSSKDLGSELRRERAAQEEAGGQDVVDLAGLPEVPSSTPSGLSAPEASGSAVDLGSRPDVDVLDQLNPVSSADDIDLDALEATAPSSSHLLAEEVSAGPAEEREEATVAYDRSTLVPEAAAEAGAEEVEEAPAEEEGELVGAAAGEAPLARPRGRAGAWLGGIGLGVLVGAIAAEALWMFGIQPPAGWRMGGEPTATKPGPGGPVTAPSEPVATTRESRADWLRRGELDRAAKAGIEEAQETNPQDLALRGEYRWLAYLQKQHQARAKLNPEDPAVKAAEADLQKAGDIPDALFWLGHLYEATGQAPKAKETYAKGLAQSRQRRFQAALDRMELQGAAGPVGWLPPGLEKDPAALAALLLIALQPPANPPAAPPAEAGEDEAGFEFWQAVKLARGQDYAAAIEALKKARQLHDRRRFTHLRKAQNPLSDPTEEIFLASCAQLEEFWQAEEKLKKAGYLGAMAQRDIGKAVEDLIKKSSAGSPQLQAVADKLVKERIIQKPDEVAKGVDQLLADRRQAESRAAELDKGLQASKAEAKQLTAQLQKANDTLARDRDELKEAAGREAGLKDALGREQRTLTRVADDLVAGKFLEPKADNDRIPAAVRKAVQAAAVADPTGQVRQLQARLEKAEAELKTRSKPEDMLAVWLPLLEQDQARQEFAARAAQDAQRVESDPAATPADKARAEAIRGLALRNEGKFAEAKAALQKASAGLKGDNNPWLIRAREALAEVSDPAAWYARRAQALHDRGQSDQALALLNWALEAVPGKEQAALLARRSLIELDMARASARGALPPTDPILETARKDAAEAAKAGLPEGLYAAGRVAEETGQYAAAADYYRKAVAAHPAADAQGSRYRIALARVLWRPGETRPAGAPLPAPAEGDKVGLKPAQAAGLLALLAVALQAPPAGDGREEAERLADEVLQLPAEAVPFDVRAQALAIKGRWAQALTTYVEGLRAFLPPAYAAGLADLVRSLPQVRRSEGVAGAANPLEAEKHYAAGLNFYFDRDYAAAEKEFLAAVDNDSQDARYFYYLALARLALNQRQGAQEALDQGAVLEAMNRPAPAVVSAALERVQGSMRRIVNDARTKPR
jgi:hypothetical protein